MLNKHNLFRASKVETKATKTTNIAMGIVEADRIARDKKTRRLRAARDERNRSEKAQLTAISQKELPSKKKPKI